jgi:ABC-type antimicrobial peptide transport system permease subunit
MRVTVMDPKIRALIYAVCAGIAALVAGLLVDYFWIDEKLIVDYLVTLIIGALIIGIVCGIVSFREMKRKK